MSGLVLTALVALAALPTPLHAQGTAYNQTTWAAVAISYHGEREPLITTASPSLAALTALGAQQALEAGSVIRTRYVSGPDSDISRSFPVHGIAPDAIDNDQLYLLAADDTSVASSALAFLQGVYPPLGNAIPANSTDFRLANGTTVNWPLGGYQYPALDIISSLDFNFVS